MAEYRYRKTEENIEKRDIMAKKRKYTPKEEILALWKECEMDQAWLEFKYVGGKFEYKDWTLYANEDAKTDKEKMKKLEGYLDAMIIEDKLDYFFDDDHLNNEGKVMVEIHAFHKDHEFLIVHKQYCIKKDSYFEFEMPIWISGEEAEAFNRYVNDFGVLKNKFHVCYEDDCIMTEKENRILESLYEKVGKEIKETLFERFGLTEDYTQINEWEYLAKGKTYNYLTVSACADYQPKLDGND